MRIHWGIQTLLLQHMLAPFGANSKRLLSKEGRKEQLLGEVTWKVFFFSHRNSKTLALFLFFFFLSSLCSSNVQNSPFRVLNVFDTKVYLQKNLSVTDCFHWGINPRYWGLFFLAASIASSRTAVRRWAAAMRYLAFSGRKKSKLALHSKNNTSS